MKQTLESVLLTRKISDEINNMTFHHHYSVLYDVAKEFGNSLINYVEIGCYGGGSACLMLQRPNTNVISIDLGEPINPEIVQQNVKKLNTLGNQFNYIQANSQKQETVDQLKTLVYGIDILFIDGDHSYEGVINDFNFYSNLVKPGCYIVFDDYNDIIHCPQVKLAVDDLLRNNSDYEIIGTLPNIFEARPSDLKEGNCFIIKKNKGMTYPIVFPTYQRPDGLSEFYIRRLLDSIYAQSHQDFEVYMIGDKYSDQEQFDQIVKSYDHRIKAVNLPYANERDKYEDGDKLWSSGGANAMNTGIEMAKRDGHSFICLQNHDDFYYPTYLEEVNRCIKITGADFVFAKGYFTNGQEFPLYSLPSDKDYHEIYPHCTLLLTQTVCMNFVKIPLLFRDVYEETGNVSPSDCDLWERVREYMVSNSLQSVFINKILVNVPEEGYTKRNIDQIKSIN